MPVKPAPTFDPADLDLAAPDTRNTTAEQTAIIERSFRFLTPMFGGGVEVKGPEKPYDSVTPIRVASIRGQLRFWWRACNPGQAKDVAELRAQEAEVWGSTSNPSAVTIAVTKQHHGHEPFNVYGRDKNGRWTPIEDTGEIAYGAFPLKPGDSEKGRDPGTLSSFDTPEFTLTIHLAICHPKVHRVSLNEARVGIEEALTAWSLFGGLGGRTRRGFGAIERSDGTSSIEAARRFLESLGGRPPLDGVPSLCGASLTHSSGPASAHAAWRRGLRLLQSFRQGKGVGRRPGTGPRPGRSFWPEAEELRRQTGSRARKHEPLDQIRRFPRAAFGLPIIFHFHPGSRDEPDSRGDPADETLAPVKLNRFASPLILRPLRNDQQFLAVALRLTGTEVPDRLALSPPPRYPADVRSRLSRGQGKTIPPMASSDSDDVLEAFLKHFTQAPPTNVERRKR